MRIYPLNMARAWSGGNVENASVTEESSRGVGVTTAIDGAPKVSLIVTATTQLSLPFHEALHSPT